MKKINWRFVWLFVALGFVSLASNWHADEHAEVHDNDQPCLVCELAPSASLPEAQADFFFVSHSEIFTNYTPKAFAFVVPQPLARGPPHNS